MSLTDALDELIESGHIAPHLARKVVEEVHISHISNVNYSHFHSADASFVHVQFDKAASQTFSTQLKNKCTSKAKLQTYRLCDEVNTNEDEIMWLRLC